MWNFPMNDPFHFERKTLFIFWRLINKWCDANLPFKNVGHSAKSFCQINSKNAKLGITFGFWIICSIFFFYIFLTFLGSFPRFFHLLFARIFPNTLDYFYDILAHFVIFFQFFHRFFFLDFPDFFSIFNLLFSLILSNIFKLFLFIFPNFLEQCASKMRLFWDF